jgi:RNA polymerase sigma-70 factor, ECF subfamily
LSRAWFLRIVRNTRYDWHCRRRHAHRPIDNERHDISPESNPETLLLQTDDVTLVTRAMRTLPDRIRERLTLRQFEDLSYLELAGVTARRRERQV